MEEVQEKLKKETHNLDQLKKTIGKSKQLTNGMCSILTSFDERLMKLEQTILPVYQETGNLQRRQENIEKLMESLDYVIQFYNVSKEVEAIIRDGPMDCLEEFLKSVDKLQRAINYFDKHNPNSPELVTLMSLFDAGGDALEREFRGLLSRHSKPMPPVLILDLVGMDDELPNEEEKHIVDQLPEKTVQDLIKIAEWLRKNRNEDFANIYATIRSSILQKSLQGLRDHQKACSGNSVSLTVQNSPMLGGRRSGVRETPPRRVSKRIQQALKKKASAAFMKYSPSVDTAFGQRFHPSLLPEMKDEILDQEIESYLTSVTALYKLMQSELQLMQGIITREQHKPVFERVVGHALTSVISEGENLASRVKKCVARHEFSAALTLFPILRHLSDMKPEFDRIFEWCTTNTIHKALEEFIDSIKNDPDTKLPKDGTVHELNSNVMMLLEQLQDYIDMLGSVLAVSDIGAAREAKDPSKLALAQYIYRVLSALGLALTGNYCLCDLFVFYRQSCQLWDWPQQEITVYVICLSSIDRLLSALRLAPTGNYCLCDMFVFYRQGLVSSETGPYKKLLDLSALGLAPTGNYCLCDLFVFYRQKLTETCQLWDWPQQEIIVYVVSLSSIDRVLSALGLALTTKSESYNDAYLKAIFRMNNLHYIQKTLHNSGLLDIVHLYNENVGGHYNDEIRDQKRIYSQSWSRVLHYVMEVDRPISQQKGSNSHSSTSSLKLKDKDRQSIKDKFTGFNKEIEEISRTQKGYAIPDVELRESLKRDNKEFILPKYQLFYDKYVKIPFTKNPEKYIKYTPVQVSDHIDKFFDAAA
ncbi:exocyst complex component 7-like [Limulus polyphemus]|uniref:Exocyst complex component 7 n=1 Tax=Limulus polyphemus TaxID=6850 RepID=A0ABM1SY21_LIMPO|nr:exocyst complex component 7-like [Limulus polyphemus]